MMTHDELRTQLTTERDDLSAQLNAIDNQMQLLRRHRQTLTLEFHRRDGALKALEHLESEPVALPEELLA